MLLAMFCLFIVLLVIYIMMHPRRVDYYDDYEDEVETTVTTTTTTVNDYPPEYNVVGDLVRRKEYNGQMYVIDPVDQDKVYVNVSDDLYEDGAGKIWSLK